MGGLQQSLRHYRCKRGNKGAAGFAGRYFLIMFDTVRSETLSMPNFISSPCILGAPHNGFAFAISMMSFRSFGTIGGLPGPFLRALNV